MQERRSNFDYEDLLACGRGELFTQGPQLPLPPMLMFDRISEIAEVGGEYGKGLVRAVLESATGPLVLPLPFQGRPGDAGLPRARCACGSCSASFSAGSARPAGVVALGIGEIKCPGQVLPTMKKVVYGIDIKRVMRSKLVLGIADGWLSADGAVIYRAHPISRSGCSTTRRRRRAELAHDAERRLPLFGKDHAQASQVTGRI